MDESEEIRCLYWDEGLTLVGVSAKLDRSKSTIYDRMVKYGIPRRSQSEALKRRYSKGRIRLPSEETRRKISEAMKNKHPSEETRQKMSESHKGRDAWNKGKVLPDRRGENHWNWQGGISDKGYSEGWTESLRTLIRERDNYTCQDCGITQDELGYKLDIHHINGNKKDSNPRNLITLCRSCHSYRHNGKMRNKGE